MADIDPSNLLLYTATCCCFSAIYTDFPALCGCSGKKEFLCLECEACLKPSTPAYECKICGAAEGKICECALPCILYALKVPAILCKGKGQCLCCVTQAAFPTDDDVPLMCAICFITLYPSCGFMKKVSDLKGASYAK